MKKNTEVLVDENGIEILISYNYEHADGAALYDVTVTSVELIIARNAIEILRQLDNKQIDDLVARLTFE